MQSDYKQQAKEILSQLTIEEKIALQTGLDVWQTVAVDRVGLPSIWVSDGPHGLRKTVGEGDNLGIGSSHTAVCMPTASKLACSFDRELIYNVGKTLAEQCRQQGVSVLLAPGINIKRNSRGGRNFEYFSEDPYLTGELAKNYVDGVQSQGIGVSLKHFAGNSQEYARMVCDSCIDERALHEIYLSAFKKVITLCKPYTVMCAYNKLNGELCSQNKELLIDLLRQEWGFDGLVMSDWGAVSDRVVSIKSGLDLQMPSGDTKEVKKAIKHKKLTIDELDKCVLRVIELVLRCQGVEPLPMSHDEQHQFARKVNTECTVLLKNTLNILPLSDKDDIAVIGEFAEKPHYQGGGSSKVNAYKVSSLLTALNEKGIKYEYSKGYDTNSTAVNQELLLNAVEVAKRHSKVVLVVGLPDVCEYEGFDRKDIELPPSHRELLSAVSNANANVVVVLQCGAPVNTSWANGVKGLLVDYLGGEAEGQALCDILYGEVNPSGRLAETWCYKADDQPFNSEFASNQMRSLYKESIFVGYRYYDTFNQPVAYPFGYGLSYSDFVIKSAHLVSDKVDKHGKLTVNVQVNNLGSMDGKTVVQLYVRSLDAKRYHANKELKGFAKVFVKAGKSVKVSIDIDTNELQYYNTDTHTMTVDGGRYELLVAYNVRDIAFTLPFVVEGESTDKDESDKLPFYYNYNEPLTVSDEQFATLYGQLPPDKRDSKQKHTIDSTLSQVRDRFWGRVLYKIVKKMLLKIYEGNDELIYLANQSLDASPLRMMTMADGIDLNAVKGIVDFVNGRPIKGGIVIMRAMKKAKAQAQASKKKQK